MQADLKPYSEVPWSSQWNRKSWCCMEIKGCKEKDGYLKERSDHIIFSEVEFGKNFHGVNTSQAAVNTFWPWL